MPIYMVMDIEVHDPATYDKYVEEVPGTVEKYGGRYVVRGGPVIPLTGDWRPERVVILEFPSEQHMKRWQSSPEYLALAPLRMRSTKARAIALEGYCPGNPTGHACSVERL